MNKNPTRSASIGLANSASASASMMFANDSMTLDDDGWTVVPFGDWPHEKGLQKFGKEQAEAICNQFRSMLGKAKRYVLGCTPVFKGHPDVPGLENEFPDKTEYGFVADMEVRAGGLAIKQVLSNAGADLIKAGWKFISPFWDADPSEDANKGTVWSPKKIISIGLVKRPNIPNRSLANSETMNKALIALLKLAADSTEEQVMTAVTALANSATSLANAQTQVTDLTTKLSNADTAKTNAETALANERKDRIESLLNDGVKTGRITAADKATWKTRLETNFATECTSLANLKATVKTTATAEQEALANLNARLEQMSPEERTEFAKNGKLSNDSMDGIGTDEIANTRKMTSLINEEMASPSCAAITPYSKRHSMAFQNVMRKNPQFGKMAEAAASA